MVEPLEVCLSGGGVWWGNESTDEVRGELRLTIGLRMLSQEGSDENLT